MAPGFRCAFRVAFLAAALAVLTGKSPAQDDSSIPDAPNPHLSATQVGVIQDWSTQHVIYTRNGSVDDMLKVRNDPRFLNSYLLHYKREHPSQIQPAPENETTLSESASAEVSAAEVQPELLTLRPTPLPLSVHKPPVKNKHTKIDWAVDLGPTYGMAIGESPAFYGANPNGTPVCTTSASSIGDFIVYSLKAVPTKGSQANLVGLTNIYAGSSPTGYCGANPTFLFSYAIGTGGSLLSPVLSLDGKKVAWIENSSANHAIFHVTTWAYGQGTNATTGSVAVGSGSSDVAIDYTSAAFSGCSASANVNTNSEIYVDYGSDTAFVGADNGILYHLKGIFKGTPTFDYCTTVNATASTGLSGGVYDSHLSTPEFFISDSKVIYGYTLGASGFTKVATYTYAAGAAATYTGPGPLLDAFNNYIYLFSADDLAGHTSVTQLTTSLTSPTVVPLGPASTDSYKVLFYGTFDNNYFNNGPKGAGSTLYTCGGYTSQTAAQALYAIGFTSSGAVNTTPVMGANINVDPPTATPPNGTCSPITEFYDGTTDRIFLGMGEHLATTGANVIQMWDVTKQLTTTTTSYKAQAANYAGGSSGIIVDNASSQAQAESLYFTTLAEGAGFTTCGASRVCAVKLTQTGLQ
jgi:hypothetical protein